MSTRPRLERDFTISDESISYEEPDPRYQRRRRTRYEQPLESGSFYRGSSHRHVQVTQEEYKIPKDHTELDELASPPPVDHRANRHHHVLENPLLREGSARKSSYRKIEGPQDDYDIPDNYTELDEIAAPAPLESRKDTRQDVLENRLSPKGSSRQGRGSRGSLGGREHKITELAAPPPCGTHCNDPSTSKESTIPIAEVKDVRHPAPRRMVSGFATELYTVSYLIFFSLLGTLARLGLQALTFYPGAPVQFGLLWANFGGSLLMGFLSEDQKLFREHFQSRGSDVAKSKDDEEQGYLNNSDPGLRPYIAAAQKQATSKQQAAMKKTIPLYIGLATGFCGSFTSFSSFIRDAYLALSNRLPVPVSHPSTAPVAAGSTVSRNGGYSFMAICAVIMVTVILCLGALLLGAHVAIALEPLTPGIPQLVARRIADRMIVFIAWTAWLGAVFMAIWPPDRPSGSDGLTSSTHEFWRGDALFALVFAPLGCLLRFYASLHLNGKFQSFPFGTFAVNIFGTVMEGLFYDLQHVPLGGRVGCQVLQGLMDGFCGCLTTVSTWVAELKGLRIRHAYVYGSVSVGVGVGLMVIIMGSFQWTMGFNAPLCRH